jgi:hypothetical protein
VSVSSFPSDIAFCRPNEQLLADSDHLQMARRTS